MIRVDALLRACDSGRPVVTEIKNRLTSIPTTR